MRVLLSVGPETPEEDEHKIADSYRNWATALAFMIPIVVASFADTKWVIAVSFAALLYFANDIAARLYDLCIRVRRTNLILRQGPRGTDPNF